MVRTLPFRTPFQLDFGRIAAMAAAIALHMAALLLLLMPMAAPQLARVIEKPERWQVPDTREVIPPPPLPPQPIEPIHQRTSPQTQPTATPITPTISATSPIDQGTLPAVDPISAPIGPQPGPIDTSPMIGSQLRYVVAPPPPYPRAEQRSGVQGTVTLRVLVDVDGAPLEVVVERSSGNRNLDREARQHVLKHWRFQPAVRDGMTVQAYGLIPISFTLQ